MTTNDASGFKATGQKMFSTSNHLFLYKKDSGDIKKVYVPKPYDKAYKFVITNKEAQFSDWKYKTIKEHLLDKNPNLSKEELAVEIKAFALSNPDIVFRTAAIGGGAKIKRKITIEKSKQNRGVVMKHPDEDVDNFYILNGEGIVFWGGLYKTIDGQSQPAQALTDVWTDIKWTGIANEGGVTLKNGKKPEKLLKRVIELATNEGDIVLDYHLGSGTTTAVAHKMNRRWIGIEQMDYINDLSEVRMTNVVNGDTSGVSGAVGWNGGGSFVYFELKKYNQEYVDRIMEATSLSELEEIYVEMRNNAFLKFWFDRSEFEKDEDFRKLDINQRKQKLADVLDENQLYLNYADMNDTRHKVSETEKKLTDKFYATTED